MQGYTLKTEKLYRTVDGVRVSSDGRIRAYKRYVGYWTVEVDGEVIGHYHCKLFYALATAERFIITGDTTQVPEAPPPAMSFEPRKPIGKVTATLVPNDRGGVTISKSAMLSAALARSGNAIGSYMEWVDDNGKRQTLRGIEYPGTPVPDDMPGACQPWEPSNKR